jgi:hypothetical protein
MRAVTLAGLAAVLGLAVLGAAFDADRPAVLRAWLVAAHLWTAVSLGATVQLLVHAITGGRWGEALGLPWRAAAAAMPVAALAWAPLVALAPELFPWAGKTREELPSLVAEKLVYLDIGVLQLRTLAAMGLFIGLAWAAGAWSGRRPAVAASAWGLAVFAISITVFTTDWLLAFEPSFYSTIYPALHGTGAVASALAVGTIWLRAAHADVDRMRDCGMLMLGWAMLWLYMAFMQYLVVWSGDLPHEIEWYLARVVDGWQLVLWLVIACHVGMVAAMVSPALKSRPDAVAAAAWVLLLGQAMDLWWRTAPAFDRESWFGGVLDVAAVAGLGGLWLAAAMAMSDRRRQREVRHG